MKKSLREEMRRINSKKPTAAVVLYSLVIRMKKEQGRELGRVNKGKG